MHVLNERPHEHVCVFVVCVVRPFLIVVWMDVKSEFKLSWHTFSLSAIVFPPLLALPFRCIDSKSRPTYAEKIFLFIGSLMFFAVGELERQLSALWYSFSWIPQMILFFVRRFSAGVHRPGPRWFNWQCNCSRMLIVLCGFSISHRHEWENGETKVGRDADRFELYRQALYEESFNNNAEQSSESDGLEWIQSGINAVK